MVWFAVCLKCGGMDIRDMRCSKCGGTSLNCFCPRCGCIVGEASSGNACVISTACVKAKNLPDDCDELQTLRFWRDKLTKTDNELQFLRDDYYINAPKIIKRIDASADGGKIYSELYDSLVLPTVAMLKDNEPAAATDYYKKYYLSLKKKFGGLS
jgi:hypothetical protein